MDFTSTGWVTGETVTAYETRVTPPGGAGTSVDTDVATDAGAVTFSGLVKETDYLAVGGTSSRRVRFRTGVPRSITGGGGDVYLWDDDEAKYVLLEEPPTTWIGPENPIDEEFTMHAADAWDPTGVEA